MYIHIIHIIYIYMYIIYIYIHIYIYIYTYRAYDRASYTQVQDYHVDIGGNIITVCVGVCVCEGGRGRGDWKLFLVLPDYSTL